MLIIIHDICIYILAISAPDIVTTNKPKVGPESDLAPVIDFCFILVALRFLLYERIL